MAKVYDALKQVEAERSRQRQMETEAAKAVEAIVDRLEAFEDLAARRLPEIERNLATMLESRARSAERDLAASLALLGTQIRHDVAALHRRVTWLVGVIAVALAAVAFF